MPPAVVPVEDGGAGEGAGGEVMHDSCHVAWLAWWKHVRCFLASTFLPCHPAPNNNKPAIVRGTLVYCKGTRVGYAARRERPSDAEGWFLEKLRAVTAGAGRLPGGGVEYLRGRFERIVASPDAESFHLTGWPGGGVNGGGFDGGLSIFFHRV